MIDGAKIIDEAVSVAKCNIWDLVPLQAMEYCTGDSPLTDLAAVYDPDLRLIILNQDHKEFEPLLEITLTYLHLDYEERILVNDSGFCNPILDFLELANSCIEAESGSLITFYSD